MSAGAFYGRSSLGKLGRYGSCLASFGRSSPERPISTRQTGSLIPDSMSIQRPWFAEPVQIATRLHTTLPPHVKDGRRRNWNTPSKVLGLVEPCRNENVRGLFRLTQFGCGSSIRSLCKWTHGQPLEDDGSHDSSYRCRTSSRIRFQSRTANVTPARKGCVAYPCRCPKHGESQSKRVRGLVHISAKAENARSVNFDHFP